MVQIKAYLGKYGFEGDIVEVADEMTRAEWEATKKQTIDSFIAKFAKIFKKVKGHDFENFGKGIYVDNLRNRQLHRAGLPYDFGSAYRQALQRMLKDKNVALGGRQPRIIDFGGVIRNKRWQQSEVEYLTKQHAEKKLTYKQISIRLGRSVKAIYSKNYRMRQKQKALTEKHYTRTGDLT